MIGFVDTAPEIKPHGGGFLVTFTSGDEEASYFLTLHALSALCGAGTSKVKAAQSAQLITLTAEQQRVR